MRWTIAALILGVLIAPPSSFAQSEPPSVSATVPRLIQVTGVFQPADGQASSAVEVVTVSIYAEPDGALPVWQERQSVAVEKTTGRFTLLLGASYPDGIPAEVFGAGQAQWMSLLFERAGEREQPRVRIASVPYALKASDAETLGGLPASAYLRAPEGGSGAAGSSAPAATAMDVPVSEPDVLPGTTNFLAKYLNGADVGNSAVYETGGLVGIGTTTPGEILHVRFNDPSGARTGLAVQNLGNTNTSFSGMLFYDQNGALAQFQGFNNVTHEYRINNIATTPSINFMLGSVSRFFVGSTGVGIGTTSPGGNLDVSNAISGTGTGNVIASTFSANTSSSLFIARKARGTAAAATGVLANDQLASFGARGHTGTAFGQVTASVAVRASENFTDTAQGSRLLFATTPLGTATPLLRMTIDPFGNLGMGTPAPETALDIVREAPAGQLEIQLTRYGGASDSGEPNITLRTARGTAAAPSPVQAGDELGGMGMTGYGTTGFGSFGAGFGAFAAETWTDTAQGATLAFAATPIGSNEAQINMVIMPGGNIAIGAFSDFPTATDRLEVSGDIRVGTTGTNGCLRNFAGTGLIGTCVSDRRYKKNITPFAPALNSLTALQPVHYFWRAEDFPQQKFGASRTYGLIAQDVEDVLPELVVTNEDGFKAVDYTKLPLLTIQAVKELKAEKDALKQRVDELERLVQQMLAAATR